MSLKIYESYRHVLVEITTVTDLISSEGSPVAAFEGKKDELLSYEGGTGIPNSERIVDMYTAQELEDNPTSGDSIELLKPNTELLIPKDQLAKELLSINSKNQFLEQTDFSGFYGKALLQLLSDPLYRPNTKFRFGEQNTLTSIFPHISVWMYVGALDEIINVSPYVASCSIAVTKEGGSFSLELPPVISTDEEDIYFQSVNDRHDFFYSANNLKVSDILSGTGEFYFHKYIQANDIVFIKFEQLEIENVNRPNDFIMDKSNLAGQIYDMIGLVDSNSKSVSFGGNEASISIEGRDFMKLLIDDGSYFFPLLFTAGLENNFVNMGSDDSFIKRVFSTGNYNALFSYSFRSITDTLKFIVNQLSNLGVVDETTDLFSSYGDRRTKVYRLDNDEEFADDPTIKEQLHNGVWQIIKLVVDINVADRRVADPSISQPDSSLIVQFQKICQEPFVEFWGDTYGEFYNFIVRQPPYTKSQIRSIVNGTAISDTDILDLEDGLPPTITAKLDSTAEVDLLLSIEPEDILSENIQWESDQIYSWYELKPQGAFLGNLSNISLAYLPIVFFPQYANKWGTRRLSHVSNYISYQAFTGQNTEPNKDAFREAVINDYKYMIDSHVYLPFTRKGSITINGDRRFKRGTWVRHRGTGEIYYVDQVHNNFSVNSSAIDRTTTLMVSRGMVESFTTGDMSYFNIVDSDFIKKVLIESIERGGVKTSQPKTNIESNFGVNQDVFDFFYSRQQFNDTAIIANNFLQGFGLGR